MKRMKSLFISFEGPEGAGKSSVMEAVAAVLSEQQELLVTREPGGVRIAEEIREIILNPENTALDGKSEMLLFAAARRVHLLEKIKPALAAGKIVLVDRFIDSSVAYQGAASGLDVADVKWLNEFATDGLKPDLTLFFDLEPEIGLARLMKDDAHEKNRLDLETLEYHKRVVAGYRALADEEPARIRRIDASQSFDDVVAEVLAAITEKLSEVAD